MYFLSESGKWLISNERICRSIGIGFVGGQSVVYMQGSLGSPFFSGTEQECKDKLLELATQTRIGAVDLLNRSTAPEAMIIKKADGTLVDVQTSARWAIFPLPGDGDKVKVALLGPPVGRVRTLHKGADAECRAFLDALAVELGAVQWCAEKRVFIPVKNDG